MRFDRITLKRMPHQSALPTTGEEHRGDLRVLTGDGSTTNDRLFFGRSRAGTLEWGQVTIARDFDSGIKLRPGFFAADAATVATPSSNQTNAIYLGQAPRALSSIVIRVNVKTAYVAGTWAEVGIAVGTPTLAGNATLTRRGFNSVATTFNSIGNKTETITAAIKQGEHVWLLWGSQGGTAYALLGGIADALGAGFNQFVSATRISTMADNTAFTASTSATIAAWAAFQWS